MKKIFLTSFLFLICFLFLLPSLSQAAECPQCPSGTGVGLVTCGKSCYVESAAECNPCGFCDFFKLISNVFNFVIKMAMVVATLMLVIGGCYFFFAGANPGALETGKKIITSVIWGLAIIFTAFMIVGVILNAIGLASWSADFYKDWLKGDFFKITGC